MTVVETEAAKVSKIIADLNLIKNFGGFCTLVEKSDADYPIGVNFTEDKNMYTANTEYSSTAFISLDTLTSTYVQKRFSLVEITFKVYLFNVAKNKSKNYEMHLFLVDVLNSLKDITLVTSKIMQNKSLEIEQSEIVLTIKTYSKCRIDINDLKIIDDKC